MLAGILPEFLQPSPQSWLDLLAAMGPARVQWAMHGDNDPRPFVTVFACVLEVTFQPRLLIAIIMFTAELNEMKRAIVHRPPVAIAAAFSVPPAGQVRLKSNACSGQVCSTY